MQYDEMGNLDGKILMLLPGTACDYQTNFASVLDRLYEKRKEEGEEPGCKWQIEYMYYYPIYGKPKRLNQIIIPVPPKPSRS